MYIFILHLMLLSGEDYTDGLWQNLLHQILALYEQFPFHLNLLHTQLKQQHNYCLSHTVAVRVAYQHSEKMLVDNAHRAAPVILFLLQHNTHPYVYNTFLQDFQQE